jgi:hypothetical protein
MQRLKIPARMQSINPPTKLPKKNSLIIVGKVCSGCGLVYAENTA